MLEFEQIRRDINNLPEEAQILLIDFIGLLKKRYLPSEIENTNPEKTLYDKFDEIGLIGCCSVEENLSTTYKEVMANSLNTKYDNR